MRIATPLLAVLTLALSSTVLAQAGTKRYQCWTDENGRRACGDRVPPQYAQTERRVYDGDGRVVEIKERQRTPEELAALEAQRKAQIEAQRKEREQREYDRFLLSTFNSVRDLEKMRDERLATLDGRIGLARKALNDNEATLKQLRDQAARAESANKKVPERVQRQIREFEKSLGDNRKGLEQMLADREQIEIKFASDLERLKALRQSAGLPPS